MRGWRIAYSRGQTEPTETTEEPEKSRLATVNHQRIMLFRFVSLLRFSRFCDRVSNDGEHLGIGKQSDVVRTVDMMRRVNR